LHEVFIQNYEICGSKLEKMCEPSYFFNLAVPDWAPARRRLEGELDVWGSVLAAPCGEIGRRLPRRRFRRRRIGYSIL
jgi:hypothetical protein